MPMTRRDSSRTLLGRSLQAAAQPRLYVWIAKPLTALHFVLRDDAVATRSCPLRLQPACPQTQRPPGILIRAACKIHSR